MNSTVNTDGEVIGIGVAYIPQAGVVALGFAILAATAVDIAGQLDYRPDPAVTAAGALSPRLCRFRPCPDQAGDRAAVRA